MGLKATKLWLRAGKNAHTFGDSQRGAPLISQNIQADAAVGVDVGVVDAGGEVDLWWLEGIVGREVNGEEENTSRVGRIALRTLSAIKPSPGTVRRNFNGAISRDRFGPTKKRARGKFVT